MIIIIPLVADLDLTNPNQLLIHKIYTEGTVENRVSESSIETVFLRLRNGDRGLWEKVNKQGLPLLCFCMVSDSFNTKASFAEIIASNGVTCLTILDNSPSENCEDKNKKNLYTTKFADPTTQKAYVNLKKLINDELEKLGKGINEKIFSTICFADAKKQETNAPQLSTTAPKTSSSKSSTPSSSSSSKLITTPGESESDDDDDKVVRRVSVLYPFPSDQKPTESKAATQTRSTTSSALPSPSSIPQPTVSDHTSTTTPPAMSAAKLSSQPKTPPVLSTSPFSTPGNVRNPSNIPSSPVLTPLSSATPTKSTSTSSTSSTSPQLFFGKKAANVPNNRAQLQKTKENAMHMMKLARDAIQQLIFAYRFHNISGTGTVGAHSLGGLENAADRGLAFIEFLDSSFLSALQLEIKNCNTPKQIQNVYQEYLGKIINYIFNRMISDESGKNPHSFNSYMLYAVHFINEISAADFTTQKIIADDKSNFEQKDMDTYVNNSYDTNKTFDAELLKVNVISEVVTSLSKKLSQIFLDLKLKKLNTAILDNIFRLQSLCSELKNYIPAEITQGVEEASTNARHLFADFIIARNRELFLKIPREEFEKNKGNNLSAIATQFDLLSTFVVHDIVSKVSASARKYCVEFYLDLAFELYELKDFSGMLAIITAFYHPAIFKFPEIKKIIEAHGSTSQTQQNSLSATTRNKKIDELLTLASPKNGFNDLYDEMNKLAKNNIFHIPFVGQHQHLRVYAQEMKSQSAEIKLNFDITKVQTVVKTKEITCSPLINMQNGLEENNAILRLLSKVQDKDNDLDADVKIEAYLSATVVSTVDLSKPSSSSSSNMKNQ